MREFADHSGQGCFENGLSGAGSGHNLVCGIALVVFLVLVFVLINVERSRPHFPKQVRFLFGVGFGIAL